MTVLGLLGVTVGHWLVYALTFPIFSTLGWGDWLLTFHLDGMTPPLNLATLASLDRLPDELAHRHPVVRLLLALAGTAVYALLAALFWERLRARFGEVTGRVP
jgi:hypothetical protein